MTKHSTFGKDLKHHEREAVITYIKLIYTKDSKLNKIENIEERKMIAAEQAGLHDLDVISLKNLEVRRLIVSYLSEQFDMKFALLVTKTELFWAFMQQLREPVDVSDVNGQIKLKESLDSICDNLEQSISKLTAEVYGSEMKELAMEIVKVSMRPEDRLKTLKP